MTKVNVPVEMNEDLYEKMEHLCQELGLDMDTAFNIFARKMVNEQSIPFEVTEKDLPEEEKQSGRIWKIAAVVSGIAALTALIVALTRLVKALKSR